MKLKCEVRCLEVYNKSSSPAFQKLAPGDYISFSTEIKAVGSSCHGSSHAVYIKCFNPQTGKESKLSFNQIENILKNFAFEEI